MENNPLHFFFAGVAVDRSIATAHAEQDTFTSCHWLRAELMASATGCLAATAPSGEKVFRGIAPAAQPVLSGGVQIVRDRKVAC